MRPHLAYIPAPVASRQAEHCFRDRRLRGVIDKPLVSRQAAEAQRKTDPLCDSAAWRENAFRFSVDSVDGITGGILPGSGAGRGAVHSTISAFTCPQSRYPKSPT